MQRRKYEFPQTLKDTYKYLFKDPKVDILGPANHNNSN